MVPVAIDPDSMGAGWTDPLAGNPNVAAAIPAVVAGTPVPTVMGTGTAMLDDDVWRFDLNIDVLREGWGDAEECSCGNEE